MDGIATRIKVSSNTEIATILASELFRSMEKALVENSRITLALSGGSTPKPMYKILGKLIQYSLKNGEIHILQGDERWTEATSERSNQKMISETMMLYEENEIYMKHLFFHAIPTRDQVESPELAAIKYIATINEILGDNSIHFNILGMGTDGHTASLFPNNGKYIELLEQKDANHVISTFVDDQNEYRISLALEPLISSERNILFVTGEEKGKTLAKALSSKDAMLYPIVNLLLDNNGRVRENIEIYMDEECKNGFDISL